MRRQIALFTLLFSVSFALLGANYRFTRLGVLQGLSSNSVGALFTDSRGFTWAGTASGLNCFDGEVFKIFSHHRNDSTSIPDDDVRSIAEDSKNMLWVGTEHGVARINPWNGKAETIKEILPDGKAVTDQANYVYVDRSKQIWAKSLGTIWKYNETKNVFEPVMSCDGKNNRPQNCCGLYEDKEGRFWIQAYNGLFLYDRKSGALKGYELKNEAGVKIIVTSMLEDRDGLLWCGSWGMGIARFIPETGKFITYRWAKNPENPSAVNIAFGLTEIVSGNKSFVWACTNHGLALITDKSLQSEQPVEFITNDRANPESISSDQANCISSNACGQLWVGTDNGISILLPEHQLFQSYAPQFVGQTTRIMNDGEGGNFFTTWYGNGLQHLDSNGNVLRSWKRVPENERAVDFSQVSDFLRAKDGSMWVATFGGLSHGDAQGTNFKLILPQEKDSTSICDRHITCLAEDHDGNIWCGSYGKGISKVNPKNYSATNYTSANSNLASDLVWTLYCTKSGEVWAATNSGISCFNTSKNKFDTYRFIKRGNDTIEIGISINLYEDSRGIFWVGTKNGLFFRKPDGSFGVYLKEDGLADNNVSGIREDLQGNIWVSTINGLSKLNFKDGTFTNYSIGSGLPVASLEGDLGNGLHGKLLLGLNNSIVAFDPAQLNVAAYNFSLFITDISVAGNTFPLSKNPASLAGTEFPWNENVISFDFVSPGFRGDPLVKYSYKLAGADEEWVNAGTRHFASYGGLQPGAYTFSCRASMGNGAWSNPVSFSFVIHPPFWKTWWFILSVVTISVLLIVIIARREATQKIRRQMLVLEKQQAVEKERNRISRDMHDDLGSGLTKIAILSEVVKKKMKTEDDSQKQVNTISESARELVDNLNEIIWALNPANDNLSNLAAYLREYADSYLEPSGIDLHFSIPEHLETLHLSEEKRRNLFLVIKEALHNIVKHAHAKKVNINFIPENEKIKIEVKDDGKGFDQESVRRFGNGLKSMQKRAEGIGATLKMESAEGKGTTITILLDTTS